MFIPLYVVLLMLLTVIVFIGFGRFVYIVYNDNSLDEDGYESIP